MPDIFIQPKSKKGAQKETIEEKRAEAVLAKHMPSENPVNIFTAYCEHPIGVSFKSQEADEIILLLLRRHLITNLSWVLPSLFFIIAPLLLWIIFPMFGNTLPSSFTITNAQITALLLFYYLVIFGYAFIGLINWYYNVGMVTQRRVVDVDYDHIVYHNVAITKLNLVQDVNYTQTGFFRSFFNYGDVFIQTAGNVLNFEFLSVPKPGKATHIIQDLIGKDSDI